MHTCTISLLVKNICLSNITFHIYICLFIYLFIHFLIYQILIPYFSVYCVKIPTLLCLVQVHVIMTIEFRLNDTYNYWQWRILDGPPPLRHQNSLKPRYQSHNFLIKPLTYQNTWIGNFVKSSAYQQTLSPAVWSHLPTNSESSCMTPLPTNS